MYQILHIPTGKYFFDVIPLYEDTYKLTFEFYSKKECERVIKNFIYFDTWQRDLILSTREQFKTPLIKWLSFNNRLLFKHYQLLYKSFHSTNIFTPITPAFFRTEFLIVPVKTQGRTWSQLNMQEVLAKI